MNKPFFIKEIFSIDDTYKNKLINLFDCDYNNQFDHLHNRKYFFKKYEPVCSIFLRSNSILALQRALDEKVDFVYNKISQLT